LENEIHQLSANFVVGDSGYRFYAAIQPSIFLPRIEDSVKRSRNETVNWLY
jgi:hypothetical protein